MGIPFFFIYFDNLFWARFFPSLFYSVIKFNRVITYIIYIACTAATESLTKSFAKEYGKFVRVNCVNPGLIKSNLSNDFFENRKKYVLNQTPIRKLCEPCDIADVVYNIVTNMKMING